jgi:Ser/Thr protein kinase RdoA (MazF antagonist)
MRERVPAVIHAAGWYAEHDIPAVRLWPDIPQPARVGPHPVTIWRQVTPSGPEPRPADLGAILRAIHAADGPEPDLPRWNITGGIRSRLAHADTIDIATRDYLTAELSRVEAAVAALAEVPPLIPSGVLHGDAHVGNLIASPTGAVICDYDATSIGPREWDLTPAAVGSLRFRYPIDPHSGLVAAYGLDVTTWPGFPALRRLRELQLVTSVLPALGVNPALRPQWQHRLDTLRSDDYESPWTPYAEIGV